MPENKTKQRNAAVEAFVEAISDSGRRADARTLVALMRAASGEVPRMGGPSIVGFGSYHYVYESGREGDAPLVGFSSRKSAMVLYLHLGSRDRDADLARLGKHTTGKGCLYIKRLAGVDQKVLERIVAAAAASMRKQYPPK